VVSEMGENDPPGSMQDTTNGRDVILFGWWEREVGVWRSEGGYDMEMGQLRRVTSLGLEKLSDLSEPYERPVIQPGTGLIRVRWTLLNE
jgi:hypothetical protein